MGSVCLDDAWQACSTSAQEPWRGGGATANVEESAPEPQREASHTSRSAPEKRSSSGRSTQRLCAELMKLRQQLDERDCTQGVVLYVALGVVAILLVVVLQSAWRLQHATECLLWYARK